MNSWCTFIPFLRSRLTDTFENPFLFKFLSLYSIPFPPSIPNFFSSRQCLNYCLATSFQHFFFKFACFVTLANFHFLSIHLFQNNIPWRTSIESQCPYSVFFMQSFQFLVLFLPSHYFLCPFLFFPSRISVIFPTYF